jgi:hypothetical protein
VFLRGVVMKNVPQLSKPPPAGFCGSGHGRNEKPPASQPLWFPQIAGGR